MMALDQDRIEKMQRDAQNAASCYFTIQIVVNLDGSMGVSGPYGDKALFLKALEQAVDVVKNNAVDRGTLVVPAAYGDAKPREEGYF
jgi:hypothetical protein